MKTQQTKHEESGCTDYLQHNADSCPHMNTPPQAPDNCRTSHSPFICPICKTEQPAHHTCSFPRVETGEGLKGVSWKDYWALKAHAQRLADALTECRDILCALTTSDSATKIAYMLPSDIPAAIKRGYSALTEYKESK